MRQPTRPDGLECVAGLQHRGEKGRFQTGGKKNRAEVHKIFSSKALVLPLMVSQQTGEDWRGKVGLGQVTGGPCRRSAGVCVEQQVRGVWLTIRK